MLSFAPHVEKHTLIKLQLVKPNSETMSESIDNISGNLGIKVEEHLRMCGFENVW